MVELLEPPALLFPVAGLVPLDEEQDGEREAGGEPGDALDVEETQESWLLPSALRARRRRGWRRA